MLGFDPATQSKEIKARIGVCLQATNLPDKMKVHEALELFDAFYTRHSTAINCCSASALGKAGRTCIHRFPAVRNSGWRLPLRC